MRGSRRLDLLERRRGFTMGQRPHVAHDIALQAEHRSYAVARVVDPVLDGDSPLQHGADA